MCLLEYWEFPLVLVLAWLHFCRLTGPISLYFAREKKKYKYIRIRQYIDVCNRNHEQVAPGRSHFHRG